MAFYEKTIENFNKLDLTLTTPKDQFGAAKTITYTCAHGFIGTMRKNTLFDNYILRPLKFISCQTCKTKYEPAVKFEHVYLYGKFIYPNMCWAPEASLIWDIRLHPDHKHTNDRFIVTIHIFERVQPEHRSFLPFLKFQPGETKTFNLNHKITFLKPGFFAKINTISTIDPDFKLVIEEQIFDDNLFGFDDKQYNN
jgi:hypothetical protein